MSKALERNKLTAKIKRLLWEFYTVNFCVYTKKQNELNNDSFLNC